MFQCQVLHDVVSNKQLQPPHLFNGILQDLPDFKCCKSEILRHDFTTWECYNVWGLLFFYGMAPQEAIAVCKRVVCVCVSACVSAWISRANCANRWTSHWQVYCATLGHKKNFHKSGLWSIFLWRSFLCTFLFFLTLSHITDVSGWPRCT